MTDTQAAVQTTLAAMRRPTTTNTTKAPLAYVSPIPFHIFAFLLLFYFFFGALGAGLKNFFKIYYVSPANISL